MIWRAVGSVTTVGSAAIVAKVVTSSFLMSSSVMAASRSGDSLRGTSATSIGGMRPMPDRP